MGLWGSYSRNNGCGVMTSLPLHREPWHDTENPDVRTRDTSFAQNEWKVEGLGPAEGRADFSEDFWRGWVAYLSDAELATLHAIVEEQQAKKKDCLRDPSTRGDGEGGPSTF